MRQRTIRLHVHPHRATVRRVRDGRGSPVPLARVLLVDEAGEPLAETRTDPEGRYTLPQEDDAAAVVVLPEGGAPAVAPRGDIVLGKGERLEGRLPGGAGARSLEVYAVAPSDGDTTLPLRLTWPVKEDGSFSGLLPAGARAWGLFEGLPVRLDGGAVSLPERVRASGRVTLPDGRPAAGATLFFRPLLNGGFQAPVPGLRVHAGDDGRFEAAGFARVRYSLEVRAEGCAARRIDEVAPADGPIEVVVRPGFRVEGIVMDARGLPVARARVRALGLPDPETEMPHMMNGMVTVFTVE